MASVRITVGNPRCRTAFGRQLWATLLKVALRHGWKPKGTKPPRWYSDRMREVWGGSYTAARGEEITAEDAAELAEAARRAQLESPTPLQTGLRELEGLCRSGSLRIREVEDDTPAAN